MTVGLINLRVGYTLVGGPVSGTLAVTEAADIISFGALQVLFDAASSANGANGGTLAGSVTLTHTPVSSSPSGAIAWVAWYDGEFDTLLSSMTYGGVAMVKNTEIIAPVGTRIDHSGGGTGPTDNGNYWKIILYGLASPPAGAQTVTATFNGLDVYPIMGVVTVTGSDLNNIFRDWGVTASGTSTSPGITVPSVTGDLVIDVVAGGPQWLSSALDGLNITDLTASGSPNTRRCNQTVTNFGNTNTAAGSTAPGASSVTTAWTKAGSSSAHWYMAGASIRAANTGWSTIPIGGGGYCDGIDIAPDGTKVLKSDTHPAPYLWSGNNWLPLQTVSSMPSIYAVPRDAVNKNAVGVWEVRICPSFTCKFYMITIQTAGKLFVTTNSGTTWTELTNFPVQGDLDVNDGFRSYCYRMAVDPKNDAIVFVGTVSGGLQRTLDSGVTWSTRTVGTGTGTGGAGMLVAFDPTSTVTSSVTQGLFVGRYGDGIYHSTDAGGSFTKLSTTGMPTHPSNLMVDQNGKLWVVDDGAGTLWSWTSGTWTQNTAIPFSFHSFDVDPTNAARMAGSAGGGAIATSADSGVTWHGVYQDTTVVANDAPWTAWHFTGGIYFITDGKIKFDTQTAGKLWQAWGLGVMYAANAFASNTAITFTTNVKGVENYDAHMIIQPPGSNPIGTGLDVPVWNFTSLTTAPSEYKPTSYNNGIAPLSITTSRGWGIDYAKFTNSGFIVAVTGFIDNGAGASGYSIYSSDNGVTWTYFPSGTQSGTPFGGGGGYYGSVAVSTPSNFVVQNGNGLYYTTNGGTTFTAATYAGNNGTYFVIPGKYIAADPNAINTFLIISPGDGIYRSTNSGATWTKVSSHTATTVGFGQRITGIPGQSGHFLMTGGYLDTGNLPQAGGALYRSTNNGTTWAAITNVGEVWCMDYGTTVTGQSYPTIYFVGWANRGSGLEFGIWKTIDNFTTFTLLGNTHNPMGWYAVINDIAGNKNVDGQCSIAYFGGGFKTFK